MAIPAPKGTPASTLRATFTEGEPGHDNRNQGQPCAIVLVNACCRTLTAFSQGDWPLPCANAAYADQRRISFGRLSSLPASSCQMMRAGHRIGIQRPWGSSAAARRNFDFRLSTLTAPLNQVRPEPHECAQSPVAESRMLSASSDQPWCHFPSLLVGDDSSESRLLILLMGKKPAKCFKEKCFTF
jgi:hypothetical protein